MPEGLERIRGFARDKLAIGDATLARVRARWKALDMGMMTRKAWSRLTEPDSLRHLALRILSRLSPKEQAWMIRSRFMRDKLIHAKIDGDLGIRIRPGDVVGRHIYVSKVFEPLETRWICEFLKPGMIFFDVGANLGVFSLLAAKRVGPSGQVHSFEPSPAMTEELRANVALNGFTNIEINPVAVADRARVARFPRYERGSEAYGTLAARVWPGARIIGHDVIQVITLDEYVAARNIREVDLLKMDIEGAELLALRGATVLLSAPSSPTLILELAEFNMRGMDYRCSDVLRFLESVGYTSGFLTAAGVCTIQDFADDLSVNATVVAWKG